MFNGRLAEWLKVALLSFIAWHSPQRHTPFPPPIPATVPVVAVIKPDTIPAQLVILVNAERARFGLRSLVATEGLTEIAQSWAVANVSEKTIDHARIQKRLFDLYPAAGEIVEYGVSTPEQAVKAWMNSPHHRDIILGDYSIAGGGKAADKWVMDFAK